MDRLYESNFYKGVLTKKKDIVVKQLEHFTGEKDGEYTLTEDEKYHDLVFNRSCNLVETCKELELIGDIIKSENFPSFPEDEYDYIYFLKLYFQIFKVKIITIIDISARLMLDVYKLKYHYKKIYLSNFNKNPKLNKTKALSALTSIWKKYESLRINDRNIIIHEGDYSNQAIEDINTFTLRGDDLISDNEYLSTWFNQRREDELNRIHAEIDSDIENVKSGIQNLIEELLDEFSRFIV